MRSPKLKNLFLTAFEYILGILTQTARKKIIFSLFYFKLKLLWAHCAPLKANRVKIHFTSNMANSCMLFLILVILHF